MGEALNRQQVSDEELTAIVRDVPPTAGEAWCNDYAFHRVQEGYSDRVRRVVFVHPDDDETGIPSPDAHAPLLRLVGRLAHDLQAARAEIDRLEHACPDCGEDSRVNHEGME